MAIRWKAVTKDRESYCAWALPKELVAIYTKGATLKAKKGSLGFLTFTSRKKAEDFASNNWQGKRIFIKVRGKGRGKRIKKIIPPGKLYRTVSLLEYYRLIEELKENKILSAYPCFAPEGTMAYQEVEVLS